MTITTGTTITITTTIRCGITRLIDTRFAGEARGIIIIIIIIIIINVSNYNNNNNNNYF